MKIKHLILALTIAMCGIQASAESVFKDVKINYDRVNGSVKISGGAESSAEPVRLLVLKPNADMQESGEITFAQAGVYADETIVSEGKFEFEEFRLGKNPPAGDYILRMAADGEVYTAYIYAATAAQTLEFASAAADADEMKECISKYNDVYGLDTEGLYKEIGNEGETYVCGKLSGGKYESAQKLRDEFNSYTALYGIYKGPWGVSGDIINENLTLLGLDTSVFSSLTSAKKDAVYKSLAGYLAQSVSDFKQKFAAAVDEAAYTPSGSGSGSGGGSRQSSISLPSVTPAPTTAPTAAPTSAFGDLESCEWARESIEKLAAKGIINGKSEGIFAPNDLLTRAQAAKMLVIAFGKTNEGAKCGFADISESSVMYPYVAAAAENGIIKGRGNGTFGADDNITRQDFAVMAYRAAGITAKPGSTDMFADGGDIAEYAKEAVSAMQSAGIINGADGRFMPRDCITRAQAAKIIAAMID